MANILIIDDDQSVLDLLTRLIDSYGYHSESLAEPEFLFQVLENLNVDLILLDINMPGIDGVSLLKQLKRQAQFSTIPVIMLTGDVDVHLQEECLNTGAVDFIHKPVNHVVLRARINLALSRQDYINQLENEIRERKHSDELRVQAESHLRYAQRMKALGTLSGGIAHDFNNILSIILGQSELVLYEFSNQGKIVKSVNIIYNAVKRAQNVVSQLLNFARTKEHNQTAINIIPTLNEALEIVKITMPSNIELSTHFDSNCPAILADSTQIYQVMVNLCINAKEAMEEVPKGCLGITLEPIEFNEASAQMLEISQGRYVHLKIRDTGKGMSPEEKECIFDPFFTTKGLGGTEIGASREGTGLGLSMVYNIIHNHRGAISVESEQGKGSTFHLYLPATAEGITIPVREEPVAEEKPVLIEAVNGLRILIAEDEVEIGEYYQEALTHQGHQVTLCNNGEEALQLFKQDPDKFDLVLTDQAMPKMTGVQLSAELHQLQPELPIILATGYSAVVAEENFRDYGILKFFTKPVDMDRLETLLLDL
ncbi:response regulator [Deltaproteobacteria bacterium TL4]